MWQASPLPIYSLHHTTYKKIKVHFCCFVVVVFYLVHTILGAEVPSR